MKQIHLNTFPVFSSLDSSVCQNLMQEGNVQKIYVKAAEQIEGGSIFCILSGTAAVYAKNDLHPALIRYLKEGDIFGAAGIYAENPNLTTIRAQTAMTMLVVPRETVNLLLSQYPSFVQAYLCFLSNRIAFLNRRIAYVTAGTSRQRLAGWLIAVAGPNDTFSLPVNMSTLAKLLDLGRASLYRAFDELEAMKLIERDGNTVKILSLEELKAVV